MVRWPAIALGVALLAPARAAAGQPEVEAAAEVGFHHRKTSEPPSGLDATPTIAGAATTTLRLSGRTKRPTLSLFGEISYRSGLGMRAEGAADSDTPQRPRARSQSAAFDFGVIGWPASQSDRIGLLGAVGYAARTFHLEAEVNHEGYAIHGPAVRGALLARVAKDRLRMEFGLRVVVAFDSRTHGASRMRIGPGLEGSARFGMRLKGRLFLLLTYTEEQALFRPPGGLIRDAGRWAMLGLGFMHPGVLTSP